MSSQLERNEVFKQLGSKPANQLCVDCGAQCGRPQWASVTNSCFFCIQCSGRHRALGVHISFVRSCTMDSWRPEELRKMKVGGNDALKKFFNFQGFPSGLSIEEKYSAGVMRLYQEKISALANDRTPKAIPKIGYTEEDKANFTNSIHAQHMRPRKDRADRVNYEGLGSDGFGPKKNSQNQWDKWHIDTESANKTAEQVWDGFSSSLSVAAQFTKHAAGTAANVLSEQSKIVSERALETTATLQDGELVSNLKESSKKGWRRFSSLLKGTVNQVSTQVSSYLDENPNETGEVNKRKNEYGNSRRNEDGFHRKKDDWGDWVTTGFEDDEKKKAFGNNSRKAKWEGENDKANQNTNKSIYDGNIGGMSIHDNHQGQSSSQVTTDTSHRFKQPRPQQRQHSLSDLEPVIVEPKYEARKPKPKPKPKPVEIGKLVDNDDWWK